MTILILTLNYVNYIKLITLLFSVMAIPLYLNNLIFSKILVVIQDAQFILTDIPAFSYG